MRTTEGNIMARFVEDIISSILNSPEEWSAVTSDHNYVDGIKNGDIEISEFIAPRILSLATARINGVEVGMGYIDRYKLQGAYKRWIKLVPLDHLKDAISLTDSNTSV
jgi:hypothetical protein